MSRDGRKNEPTARGRANRKEGRRRGGGGNADKIRLKWERGNGT